MTIASLCFMVAGLLLCTPIAGLAVFAAASLENALHLERQTARALPPLLWTLLAVSATLGFQLCCNRFVFFTGPRGNKWLRHRFWYALYDYNMIFSNVLVGIVVMTWRFVLWLSLGIFCLGRIDLCLMPGPGQLQFSDLGFKTYAGPPSSESSTTTFSSTTLTPPPHHHQPPPRPSTTSTATTTTAFRAVAGTWRSSGRITGTTTR